MQVIMKPTSVIKTRLGIEPGGKVHKFFTDTCYRYMDKYVPMDTGDLRTIVSMDLNGGTITYEMPYAKYQYYGMREDGTHVVKNYTTPDTGTYWDRKMVSADIDKVIEETQNYMRR